MRIPRVSGVRRCDNPDVGWALMGDGGPSSRQTLASAGSASVTFMLYCLAVGEDPINRPTWGVGGRGLGNRAAAERTAPSFCGRSGSHVFSETLPPSRNSRSFKVYSSGSASAREACQPSQGSAALVSRPDSPSRSRDAQISQGQDSGLPGIEPPQRSRCYGR